MAIKQKIIFYAPLGKDISPEKIGGAESGCLKTKAIYEKAGIEVIDVDKPAMSRGKLRFMAEMAVTPAKLTWKLIVNPHAILHIVGFYSKIVGYERLLYRIGKLLGHRVVYELRNGSMVVTYNEGTPAYRKKLADLLIGADVVLCQGQEYVDMIRKEFGLERSYYPNFIMDDFILPNNLERGQRVRLIYFGRVTESKNVDVIIDTLGFVRKAGVDAILEVIGGYNDNYKAVLDKKIMDNNVADYVTFYGRKPFSFIVKILRQSQYFVFPSTEKQEGHSNSLTEAMGCGVVPIASTAGFNVSICGNKDLIVDRVTAKDFAKRIISIETQGRWSEYSEFVYQRVVNNYTQTHVGENLIGFLKPLFH